MAFFGKKPEATGEFGGTNIPVSQVLNMKAQGMNNSQIANQLRSQGFSLTQIRDALAQADIKSAVGTEMPAGQFGGMPPQFGGGQMGQMPEMGPMPDMGGMPELGPMPEVGPMPDFGMQESAPMPEAAPAPPSGAGQSMGMAANTEVLVNELQKIMEEIIEEKWKGVSDKLTSLEVWKAKVEEKTNALSDNVKQLTSRIDEFAITMAGKTDSYTKTVQDVNVQMEAMDKMMGKLVPSLAEEIKELRDVVEKVKSK